MKRLSRTPMRDSLREAVAELWRKGLIRPERPTEADQRFGRGDMDRHAIADQRLINNLRERGLIQ